jgi:iron(III) transport system ATP-binding protein
MVDVRLDHVSAAFNHPSHGAVAAVRDVSLHVASGELLTLLGPSGCGKTTTLRMIAGFQPPSHGTLFIGDQDVTRIPANRRDIGFVFQNYALFPHLTVQENVAYGLRVRRQSAGDIARNLRTVLRLVDLEGFGPRLPHELSGGQQQRVALARAIVIAPRVLLFDEPLSNLDAKLRVQMRDEIRALQRKLGITTIYVTHDQEEAMAISDRIAVMDRGQVVQCDTAEELYRRPVSAFVASFLGRTNLLEARLVSRAGDQSDLDIDGQRVTIRATAALSAGATLKLMIRPEAIRIGAAGGDLSRDGAQDDRLTGTVVSSVYLGDKVEYQVRLNDQTLQVVRFNPAENERFMPGAHVSLRLPPESARLLPGA